MLMLDSGVRIFDFCRRLPAASGSIGVVVSLMAVAVAQADSVKGVGPAVSNPIGPRGSVMMVPLVAERPGGDWPRTLDVRMADGTRLRADVAWVHPAPPRAVRRWTDDPRRLAIRAIERCDDTSRLVAFGAGLGPYLLLRVPEHAEGALLGEGVTINPIWRDVPWDDPLREEGEPPPADALILTDGPDRPDPDSPFEYWRWVLLADRLGLGAPAPSGDEIQKRAAEHYAALWRIGLGRLAGISRRIALECREALTHTALDRGRPAAAWVADPQQASVFLGLLVDFSRDEEAALTGAVAWLDQQTPIMLWPESESGDVVRIALASLRPGAWPVRFSWLGVAPNAQPPSAIDLEGGVIAHVSIDRLPMETGRVAGIPQVQEPATQMLRVTTDAGGGRAFDLTCGPRMTKARPPGVFFPALTAPLTLADVQFNVVRPVDPDRATLAHIRRLGGRWEVFIECRRIAEEQQRVDPSSIRTYEDLRGIEAVTILLGADDEEAGDARAHTGPSIWLTIPEHDWPVLARGLGHPDLQVHKRSFADRWTCRIVLPDQWFSAGETNPALIGFIRSHCDSRQVETGPAPSPPWRIAPGRAAIELDHWDDLPAAEE